MLIHRLLPLIALGSLLEIGALSRTLTQGLVARVPVLHASLHSL